MTTLPVGELAALAAAILWAFTSVSFTTAGRLTTPVAANTFKCATAALLFTAALFLRSGAGYGAGLLETDLALLVASGVLGLAIGDSCLFASFVLIGTRRALLLLSLSPVIGTLAGIVFLQEMLSLGRFIGIFLALAGVAWVIGERKEEGPVAGSFPHWRGDKRATLGVLFGLGAMLGQASGAVLAKAALQRVDTLTATQIRMVAGAVALVAFGAATGRLAHWSGLIVRSRLIGSLLIGSFFSQVVAVWLMIVSLDRAPTGIALTLMSTVPIWLLPFGARLQNDRPTRREILGVLVALAGVAVLLLRPS